MSDLTCDFGPNAAFSAQRSCGICETVVYQHHCIPTTTTTTITTTTTTTATTTTTTTTKIPTITSAVDAKILRLHCNQGVTEHRRLPLLNESVVMVFLDVGISITQSHLSEFALSVNQIRYNIRYCGSCV